MSIASHVTGLQHVGVPTRDMQATLAFYQSLGFEVALRAGTQDAPVAFLRLKNLTVETYLTADATGIPGAIDHIALDVDDIEAAYADVSALGYKALDGLRALPFWQNGVRFFTIQGPNGEKVEFSQML